MQILFASGDTRPSVVLVRDVDALPSAALAALLLAALSGQLTELLLAGAIATLTPERGLGTTSNAASFRPTTSGVTQRHLAAWALSG